MVVLISAGNTQTFACAAKKFHLSALYYWIVVHFDKTVLLCNDNTDLSRGNVATDYVRTQKKAGEEGVFCFFNMWKLYITKEFG